MRRYLTLKATRLVFVLMVATLITLSCTLKSPYNATMLHNMKLASLDRRARNIIKSTIPSIGNLANHERALFEKKGLCQETNAEFNKCFQVLEHKWNLKQLKKY